MAFFFLPLASFTGKTALLNTKMVTVVLSWQGNHILNKILTHLVQFKFVNSCKLASLFFFHAFQLKTNPEARYCHLLARGGASEYIYTHTHSFQRLTIGSV